ncbi:hypothetical protein [Halosimplex rubrum]|uniref:hypothetical protein n=1 Tax=Halosimplex rubrum TaxID=869889 RepID=UPI001C54DC06|nr:hypothetical protein [Halosimplex rubrum]
MLGGNSKPDSDDFEFWNSQVFYDDVRGFAADSIFFVQVYVDTQEDVVADVRCNCDTFEYPNRTVMEEPSCRCEHAEHAAEIVQYQLNHNLRQSDSLETLPIPECLQEALD